MNSCAQVLPDGVFHGIPCVRTIMRRDVWWEHGVLGLWVEILVS